MKNRKICFKIGDVTLNLIADSCYSKKVPVLFQKGNNLTIQLCLYSFDLQKKDLIEKNTEYLSDKNCYKIKGEVIDVVNTYSRQELLLDCKIPIRISINKEEKTLQVKKGEYLSGSGYLYGDFESLWENNHLIQKVKGKIIKVEECLNSNGEICLSSKEVDEFEADIFTKKSIYITLLVEEIEKYLGIR